jgi:hypothetical protein
MTQNIEEFANQRKRRFDWVAILPKRKAWLQTLILLPFGLPIANFMGASWNIAVNSIVETQQYLQAICLMIFNLCLPSLFMAFLFHWGWFIWRQSLTTWYPNGKSLWAGIYATMTIACSFAIVEIFNKNMGVCGNGGWGVIGDNLFCNLNGYGFESKSWFGVWFIIAAYCYQSQSSLQSLYQRYFSKTPNQNLLLNPSQESNLGADEFGPNPLDQVANSGEE